MYVCIGDLCWTCRTCGKDQTCVLCDQCFQDSDHQGHEVFFHTSTGEGGCCDCGDSEAWAVTGNCSLHGGGDSEDLEVPSLDPIKTIPPELYRGLKAVALGSYGVVLSYMVCTVRAYEPYATNPFIDWCDLFEVELRVR